MVPRPGGRGCRWSNSYSSRGIPVSATARSTSPSSFRIMPASAEHSRVAFSARVWSTGVRSNVERLMTLRISLVAACCANAPARLFSRWRTLALSFFGDAIAWLPPFPSEALHGDPLTLRIQLERGGQELLHVLDRRSVGRRVVRDGGTSLHAGIVQREQLARLAIHDLSPGPFVQ